MYLFKVYRVVGPTLYFLIFHFICIIIFFILYPSVRRRIEHHLWELKQTMLSTLKVHPALLEWLKNLEVDDISRMDTAELPGIIKTFFIENKSLIKSAFHLEILLHANVYLSGLIGVLGSFAGAIIAFQVNTFSPETISKITGGFSQALYSSLIGLGIMWGAIFTDSWTYGVLQGNTIKDMIQKAFDELTTVTLLSYIMQHSQRQETKEEEKNEEE